MAGKNVLHQLRKFVHLDALIKIAQVA
jgi:hypothetical protein